MRVGGEPFRKLLAFGDAPGEVRLQRVGVDEIGRERLGCIWSLALGNNPMRRFGRGRFRHDGGQRLWRCFGLLFDPLGHINPRQFSQPSGNSGDQDTQEAPQPIGLKEITYGLPHDLLELFEQVDLD